ncbi:hypothetical protein E4188_22430 (plasmid) [Aeromonas media]|uniref:Uncharacterized protein n=1 Tax=Aeromonas media TaxID=651 RepID=A0ABX6NZN7_AERME|nr:hypothetical protein [Aeromonas media]QJT36977.1 hypothetical protein E4187_22035 [Aeromonas media]QJT41258.1 hypothetical protein E4188_22430 [Aeromonas media]
MKRTIATPAQIHNPAQYSFDYYYYRFKRAKCEDTLDIMYKGAVEKASVLPDQATRTTALINIERALDRCQQDFDTTAQGIARKVTHSIKKSEESLKPYDPVEEMAKMLSTVK